MTRGTAPLPLRRAHIAAGQAQVHKITLHQVHLARGGTGRWRGGTLPPAADTQ